MIKLVRPYIPQRAIRQVVKVLESGNLVQGRYVEKFEVALQDYLGVRYAIAVSSGTAALHLSLVALDVKKDDQIIVPAFTFPATSNVVEILGAKSVFVDISLDDFCIDASRIEESLTDRTKVLLPVHEFGQSAEIGKILAIARKHNLKIVEDAACAIGSEFNGKKVGTFGEFGCFSFHPRKAITTGEGGAIVTNDDELAERVRSLRNHGISIRDGRDFVHAGFNYRMTDFQAVLGLFQLSNIENIINTRIRVARKYNKYLAEVDWIKIPAELRGRKNTFQTYHILVDDKVDRDNLIDLLRRAKIETNLGAQALNCLTYYRKRYNHEETAFANAVKAFKHGLALPIGNHINNNVIKFIVGNLKEIGQKLNW